VQLDLPYLVANVGITSTNTQLLLNIIYAIGGWIPAIIGARLHDVVGRRKMMMSVAFGMAVCLSIAAGTAAGYVQTGSKAASSASIAFIYVFGRLVSPVRGHARFHEPLPHLLWGISNHDH
jgi:MFS family permease